MGKSLENAEMLTALATLKAMLQATMPLYREVADMALREQSHALAFSANHMATASESFYQELESFVYKVMNQ